jgi:acyl-CoA thioester hydrolase
MTVPAPSEGLFDGPVHRFAVRAYYEDTDLTGAVYHANYLKWFERARSDLVRQLGIDQRAAQESGDGTYAVAEVFIRYLAPARLDDVVVVETRAEEVRAASCRLVQQALRGDVVLAEGRVRVGFIGLDGRPKRQPAEWLAAFSRFMATDIS